ncbi:MAG: porin family protein [Gammaproteobacteria bacterium]|nr:porin family protein [Gammaproteobacteria bacterium]
MIRKIYGVVFVAALFCSANSFAASGFSAELLIGSTDFESEMPVSFLRDVTDSDTSIGIRGMFLFNDNFAVELSLNDYGTLNETYLDTWGDTISETFEVESTNIGVVGFLPLSETFSLSGRVGLADWDADYIYTDTAFGTIPVVVASDSDTDLYYGIGARYNAANGWLLSLEYTTMEFDGQYLVYEATQTLNNLGLAIGYKF